MAEREKKVKKTGFGIISNINKFLASVGDTTTFYTRTVFCLLLLLYNALLYVHTTRFYCFIVMECPVTSAGPDNAVAAAIEMLCDQHPDAMVENPEMVYFMAQMFYEFR